LAHCNVGMWLNSGVCGNSFGCHAMVRPISCANGRIDS
jgi:hypothetical protein